MTESSEVTQDRMPILKPLSFSLASPPAADRSTHRWNISPATPLPQERTFSSSNQRVQYGVQGHLSPDHRQYVDFNYYADENRAPPWHTDDVSQDNYGEESMYDSDAASDMEPCSPPAHQIARRLPLQCPGAPKKAAKSLRLPRTRNLQRLMHPLQFPAAGMA